MTGQEILNSVHVVRDPDEMATKLVTFKGQIKTFLNDGAPTAARLSYYKNHIGRELFRKLHIFGMDSDIPDTFSEGFRPTAITNITA
jgi:hypothetical protein